MLRLEGEGVGGKQAVDTGLRHAALWEAWPDAGGATSHGHCSAGRGAAGGGAAHLADTDSFMSEAEL